MCIYCGTAHYRKIYENHFGQIPRDDQGRSYHIHHIDGDRNNNSIENLQCVSIQEHYNIHLAQGDYAACLRLSKLLKLTQEEISEIARRNTIIQNQKRVENGTHNFLGDSNPNHRRLADGTHHFLGANSPNHRRLADGTHNFLTEANREAVRERNQKHIAAGTHAFSRPGFSQYWRKRRVEAGTHNFLGKNMSKKLIAEGRHQSQKVHTCPHCNKTGKSSAMFRHHFDRCKQKPAE